MEENIFLADSKPHDLVDYLQGTPSGCSNLGDEVPVLVYRFLEYSLRDALVQRYGKEEQIAVFRQAGRRAGELFAEKFLRLDQPFDAFVRELQARLREFKIGVLRMEDVTDKVLAQARKEKVDVFTMQSQRFLAPLAEKLFKKSDLKKKKGVVAHIASYYGANRFYLIYEQTFLDVRLVANPPYNIGQFGGNSDNWMWPRQNADFAMFRIYADKNGDPAPYSEDNVPLKVKKYLPISLKGPNLHDYTMVMGFPGRTSRYLTAAEVELRCKSSNEPFVIAGNPLLKYYKELMDQSDELRLLLEDDYFSWGNSIKNFGGMNEAVEKGHLVEQKRAEEKLFRQFAAQSGKPEYADIIDRIERLCTAYKDTLHDQTLAYITLHTQKFGFPIGLIMEYDEALKKGKEAEILKAKEEIMKTWQKEVKPVNLDIDRKQTELLIPYFEKYHKLDCVPAFLAEGKDWKALVEKVYTQSVFADSARLAQALGKNDARLLTEDPLTEMLANLGAYSELALQPAVMAYTLQRYELDKIYVCGLCDMYQWAKAPDANFTLRMTYGHVCDLKPRDAVRYDWRTVLDGMFEKESKTESDYFINERLRSLYQAKDFGRYAREDGKLPTCFLSNNDITGGNSGSPVMNARGELIGLAFDGNIESLSSDLQFNPTLQRCINVDIRYVLFIIDKFGGAKYVLDELDIR